MMLGAIIVPPVIYAALRWQIPAGSLAIVFGVGLGTSALPHEILIFVPVAFLAGLITEALARTLRPTFDRPLALASLGVLTPSVVVAIYFGAIAVAVGVAWPAELWIGSIVLAGGVGLVDILMLLGVQDIAR